MADVDPTKLTQGSSRRNFLKKGTLSGLGLSMMGATSVMAESSFKKEELEVQVDASTVTILVTADIHAQLNTHDEFFWEDGKAVYKKRGGFAVLKTMITKLRNQNPNTILYDGGDFFHGSAVATKTEGEALIPIMNAFDYDLILPGNWEVVYKKKKMLYDMGHSTAAKICANMWHQSDGPENGELIFSPYWIKMIAGAKIGFIGYTDHLTPKRQSPAYSKGIRFAHAEVNVARYIKYLKEVENCGVVIVVTHMGLAQQVGLANNPVMEGADLLIGADTHERVREPIQCKYAKVVECGAFGSFLGKIDLHVKDGKLASLDYALLDVDPEKYSPDKTVQHMVDAARKPFQEDLDTVIGVTTTPLVRYFVLETPMDNLIADAIMWRFKPDIALSNGFRFCQPLAVTKNGKANITREFLWNMLPVDSEAKKAMVSGQQIWDWLEKELQNAFAKDPSKRFGGWFVRFSGMQVNFTIGNELGKRVNWVKIGGVPLDPTKMYSVVACEREGDPYDTLCRIEKVLQPQRLGENMHHVIESYLEKHSPVAPVQEQRAVATDADQKLLTQLQGTGYTFR